MIEIEKLDEIWVRVHCDRDIAQEIYDRFSYFVPGAFADIRFREGDWDREDSFL